MARRATAYRMRIRDVLRGSYVRSGTITSPNYVEIDGTRVSRVMLMGKIAETYLNVGSQYGNILLDDSSAKIRVKFFGDGVALMEGFAAGDTVRAVGKIRESNNERFILGEIVKKMDDPNYQMLFDKEVLTLKSGDTGA